MVSKKPDLIVYYCKALKKTGKPIIIRNISTGKERTTNSFSLKNVTIKMVFNNSTGSIKRRGATTVLEVFKNET